jgi:hypothetical protein
MGDLGSCCQAKDYLYHFCFVFVRFFLVCKGKGKMCICCPGIIFPLCKRDMEHSFIGFFFLDQGKGHEKISKDQGKD